MTVEVEVGGRLRQVDVRPAEEGVAVTIDGHTRHAVLARTPHGWSLLLDGRSHEIAVHEQADETIYYVDGRAVPVVVPDARWRFGSGAAAHQRHAHGPKQVVAPMPGRVVKVLVKPGDMVAARQGLVVVEAMKMENELRAPASGTVTEVRARQGASVEANAVLVVLE